MMKRIITYMMVVVAMLTSCRDDEVLVDIQKITITQPEYTDIDGFYLLNEGNMGNNKSTLDYFNYNEGTYYRNIYAERNPNVVKELGDVGNDLMIYDDLLWAVINCSHKVEVMDAETAVRVAKIDIPNCRKLAAKDDYVYVSSYVGPVQIDPHAPKGAVFKVNAKTFAVEGSVEVGYQPEEMTIMGDRLYVANSGGYRAPDYDNTISVIDLEKFQVVDVIVLDTTANFQCITHDKHGRLWLSSRGNYYGDLNSDLFVIDAKAKTIIKDMELAVSSMWVDGDCLYVISAEWSYITGQTTPCYVKIDMNTMEILDRNIIKDATDKKISVPYGIAVNPITKDFYITDAKSYVVSGTLYCFSDEGILKWKQTTGQIPAHFAFKGKLKE